MKTIEELMGTASTAAPAPAPTPKTSHRPSRLAELVGQARTREYAAMKVRAALATRTPMKHTLLLGPSGVGKTTFSKAIAAELGVPMHEFFGPQVGGWGDLEPTLRKARRGEVVFIDEIHDLGGEIQDKLYQALEDRKISAVSAAGELQETILEEFTVIGATTHMGRLKGPLLGRFKNQLHLALYTKEELGELTVAAARRQFGWELDETVAQCMGALSQGVARNAMNLLDAMQEVAADLYGAPPQGMEEGARALREVLVYESRCPIFGLPAPHRRVLRALDQAHGGRVGLATLGSKAGEEDVTVKDVIEPFLLRESEWTFGGETHRGALMERGGGGRVITNVGRAYLKACRALQDRGYMPDETL